MKWQATGKYSSIEALMQAKTGVTAQELMSPRRVSPSSILNLQAALDLISDSINRKDAITVVGDYDADGVTSTAILVKLIRRMGANPATIIPRRFTDGYGISKAIVEKIKPGLIITVDNGIAAVEEVQLAKSLGSKVIILDHHLPGEMIPCADVIVDPHLKPEENGFVEYCGAGLALKLAELFLLKDKLADDLALLKECYVLATIGTIADVMPLLGDNRFIVKKGLNLLATDFKELSPGLRAIFASANSEVINEETIAFKIAPMLNAPGRLYNAGATSVLKTLLCLDEMEAASHGRKLIEINQTRKEYTEKAFAVVCEQIEAQGLHHHAPICLYASQLHEGLVGLITGKVAEKYKKPAFLFTDSTEDGILKGSGRSVKGFDLKPMLSAIKPVVEKCGGHSGAAGVSVSVENRTLMTQIMREMAAGFIFEEDEVLEYDIVVRSEHVPAALAELKKYAPFGAGVEKPVVVVSDFKANTQRSVSHFRFMGSDNSHIRLNGPGYSAVGFGLAEEYIALGTPESLHLLGTLSENVFRGVSTPQLQLKAIRAS